MQKKIIVKSYSNDEGVLSIMYHRFNEKNIPQQIFKWNIFKEHIKLLKISNYNFIIQKILKKNLINQKIKRKFYLLLMMDLNLFIRSLALFKRK